MYQYFNHKTNCIVTFCLIAVCFFSCQTNRPYYANKQAKIDSLDLQKTPDFNLFLIGDAGAAEKTKGGTAINYLGKLIPDKSINPPKSCALIFLGDNVYPKGMPKPTHEKRNEAENALKPSLEVAKKCFGKRIFIPGNHEWYNDPQDEADYIFSQDSTIEFLPANNCPGPVVPIKAKNFSVIIIDSQWFLQNQKSNINTCKQSDSIFWKNLADTLQTYQNKPIILIGHHPLISNGHHGGYYHWLDHIFPIRQITPYGFIPLPVIGTIMCLTRKWIGHNTDLSNARYREFSKKMIHLIGTFPNIHYVSGHDHNLQFHHLLPKNFDIQHPFSHTVSGSGSKSSYVGKRNHALFTAQRRGFAVISVIADTFFMTIYDAENECILFRRLLF
ncbi:MAG: metallophosphoesterase [Bacteroidia bacterium]|nr:metallophosphoesterase [Bacteroidia bacterium]